MQQTAGCQVGELYLWGRPLVTCGSSSTSLADHLRTLPTLQSVVHAIAPAPHGGAESVVLALAEAWKRAGGAVEVVALMVNPAAAPFVERLRSVGIVVTEVQGGLRGYLREVRAVRAALTATGAQVLHTHGYRADAVGFFASRRAYARAVATAHGFTGGDWKNRRYEQFDRSLLCRFDAVACVSAAIHEQLLRSGARAACLRQIPNSLVPAELLSRIDARRALGLPEDGKIVGWIGRLSAEKSPTRFVEAMGKVEGTCLGALIGDGPELGAVRAAAQPLGDRVRVIGPRENARQYLKAFDAIALSSHTEGTPMVLLEAMQAGVPIATFGVGGVPALVGNTALVVGAGDVAGLASAISALLSSPAISAEQAVRAQHRLATRFGEEAWVRAYEQLYELAVQTSPSLG